MKRLTHRSISLPALAILLLTACDPPAEVAGEGAATRTGSGGRSAESFCDDFRGRDIDELIVPDGELCVLEGARVDGSIKVGTGSTLIATGVYVDGNIQSEGSALVDVATSTIEGSVQIKQGREADVFDSIIGGDLQLDDMSGFLAATDNVVGGNLQAVENTGGLLIRDNDIDGNLQCKQNRPAPVGSGNRAASKEDQCERL